MSSRLDQQQIIKAVYDEATTSLKTSLTNVEISMELSATDGDSVRSYRGDEPASPWDYYSQALSAGDTVVTRTYKNGGASGTVVGTVVYTYSDNTRAFLVSMSRS